jgi:isopentenyldiphosphate isomerase
LKELKKKKFPTRWSPKLCIHPILLTTEFNQHLHFTPLSLLRWNGVLGASIRKNVWGVSKICVRV